MQLKTRSGKSVHPVGIGTWGIGGKREKETGHENEEIMAIKYSLSKGQNHIDTAELYGDGYTDVIVGQALQDTAREDVFIADKLWLSSVGEGQVKPAVETMLKKLGTNYIDLLYIHKAWDEVDWRTAVAQIDDLIDAGIVRYFGVSNFNLAQIKTAMKLARHNIAANQIYYNVLYKKEATSEVLKFCAEHGIQIIAYRPVERSEVAGNSTIQKIAASHTVSSEQIALVWLLSQKVLTIPKSLQSSHIDQNIAAIDIVLSPTEIDTLNRI